MNEQKAEGLSNEVAAAAKEVIEAREKTEKVIAGLEAQLAQFNAEEYTQQLKAFYESLGKKSEEGMLPSAETVVKQYEERIAGLRKTLESLQS